MHLTIARCSECHRARLVDSVGGKWICLVCKQKIKKAEREKMLEPIPA